MDPSRPAPTTRTLQALSPREQAVYAVLANHPGQVVSRAEIARETGMRDLSARACETVIYCLRRRFGPRSIVTVRRRGWMLVA